MGRPHDELAARRFAKAEAEKPSDLVRALELIDWSLCGYMDQIADELLVPVADVRAFLERVDRMVLDQFHAAREAK